MHWEGAHLVGWVISRQLSPPRGQDRHWVSLWITGLTARAHVYTLLTLPCGPTYSPGESEPGGRDPDGTNNAISVLSRGGWLSPLTAPNLYRDPSVLGSGPVLGSGTNRSTAAWPQGAPTWLQTRLRGTQSQVLALEMGSRVPGRGVGQHLCPKGWRRRQGLALARGLWQRTRRGPASRGSSSAATGPEPQKLDTEQSEDWLHTWLRRLPRIWVPVKTGLSKDLGHMGQRGPSAGTTRRPPEPTSRFQLSHSCEGLGSTLATEGKPCLFL